MKSLEEIKDAVSKRYRCRTPKIAGIRPELIRLEVYGDHASYVEGGYRIWGFVSKRGRDLFVGDFKSENAEVM